MGSVGGPFGTIAGAALGIGIDYTANAGIIIIMILRMLYTFIN